MLELGAEDLGQLGSRRSCFTSPVPQFPQFLSSPVPIGCLGSRLRSLSRAPAGKPSACRRSAVRREGGSSQTMSKNSLQLPAFSYQLVERRCRGEVLSSARALPAGSWRSWQRGAATEYPANGSFNQPTHTQLCVHFAIERPAPSAERRQRIDYGQASRLISIG